MEITKRDIRYLTECIRKRLVREGLGFLGESELDGYEEYLNGYQNSPFDPQSVGNDELIEYCRTIGDFLYIFNGLRGWAISAANTSKIVNEIVNDIRNASVTLTHKFDSMIQGKVDFDTEYVGVYEIKTSTEKYYIIYQIDK